jgi:hypothetical protein
MSTSGDWLPRPRAAQIEMARRWKPLVAVQQTAWNIAPADVARLEAAILSVDAAQASFDNSATPGNRAAHRAKPRGYDGAVLIWAVGGTPFTRLEDLRDGNLMASRTPHTLVFTDDQRGKTVSVALAWQNERGIRGEWGEILSTIVP